jgi:predicted nucleotidyltransferase
MNRPSALSAGVASAALLIPGLSQEHSQAILEVLTQHPKLEAVVLYGSRAMGRQHPGSDIDLCLQAPEMSLGELLILGAALDDLLLPWSIDLQLQHLIRHPPLLDHIQRVGVTLCQQSHAG